MQENDRSKLMHFIDEVSFAIDDVTLYLDTHPEDAQAIDYYETYQRLRKQAVEEYTRRYGPLLVEKVPCGNHYWSWVSSPWPWEGGCN